MAPRSEHPREGGRKAQREPGLGRKYTPEKLLAALRIFVTARNAAIAAGFTDNGGAIHSIERILDILSMAVVYPRLTHSNKLKRDPDAPRSRAANAARTRGEPVRIEHVAPQRAFATKVTQMITRGATDKQVLTYIRRTYRLVLLTERETAALNRINRSRMTRNRLSEAGIKLHVPRKT